MKKTFSFLFLVASYGYAFANKLTISSNSRYNIKVMIDGRFYQPDRNNNDAAFMISDLRPGNRNIQIYQQKNNGRGWQANNNDRNMQLIYNGNLFIKQGFDVDISINRFGRAFIDEQPINRYEEEGNGYDNSPWNNGPQAMNDRSFQQLKQSMSRDAFEDARINIGKTAVANNYASSSQVKELMQLFNFENNKLELAKYCYRFATDKENFYSVADGLQYSSSKNELMQFIQQNR